MTDLVDKGFEYTNAKAHAGGREVIAAFAVHTDRVTIEFEVLSATAAPGDHSFIL